MAGDEKAMLIRIQIAIWVNPTAPTPIILPPIRSRGVTQESMTSMMRELFSSITERITAMPYIEDRDIEQRDHHDGSKVESEPAAAVIFSLLNA